MTALTVCQDVALAVGLERPTEVFSSTDREWREMQSVLNQAAGEVVDAFDWQKLRAQHTATGDGASEERALPSNYRRMLKKARLWSSRWRWAMEHVVDSDQWLELTETFSPVVSPFWTIFGNALHILPIMQAAETAKFFYITNDIVTVQGGGFRPAFNEDTDTFVLDELLLTYATVYRWKQRKGWDFTAELADYEQRLATLMDSDGGSKPVVSGNNGARRPSSNLWPGTVTG